jgi:hypothetical protein
LDKTDDFGYNSLNSGDVRFKRNFELQEIEDIVTKTLIDGVF